jgi:hypothetical protein
MTPEEIARRRASAYEGRAEVGRFARAPGFYSPTVMAENIPDWWPTFYYRRRHIKMAGTESKHPVRTPDRLVFLEVLALWSKSAPDDWQYWECGP